ncbi:MAG: helix-turn-helix domain-containing protein [Roseibium sp.]|uniref:AraC family transcriptional regulator n=1 Tax=Roseibium sp. TaxID=1936156 RepID=UPI003D9C5DF7
MEIHPFIKRLACEDVDDYSDLFDGWTHTITQMEAGRFGYRGLSVTLPGLKIFIDMHTRSLRWCEYPHIPVTAIFIPLQSSGEVRWRGREMSAQDIVVQGTGEEQHFVTGAHMQAIYIDIGEHLMRDLGWNELRNGHVEVAAGPRERLARYCQSLVASRKSQDNAQNALFHRNAVLRLLREMLFPAMGADPDNQDVQVDTSDFEVLLLCEDSLREAGMTKPLANFELARRIGISERRLYRVFESQIGMSPARYIELLRLHALRRHLQSESHKGGRIADTMTQFGFTNAGRTARRYSELFHEYPKETASRGREKLS